MLKTRELRRRLLAGAILCSTQASLAITAAVAAGPDDILRLHHDPGRRAAGPPAAAPSPTPIPNPPPPSPPAPPPPYPPSTILTGIAWDESSRQRYAAGSDIWDSAWASDGQIYGVWGDGNGFTGAAKSQIGVTRLGGSPDSPPLTGTDVYYGSPAPPAAPCAQKPTVGGKSRGIVALPASTLYLFHSTEDLCTRNTWLARSDDDGVSWSDDVGGLQWPDSNGFSPVAVLQYGPGQAGALNPDSGPTSYVFIYAGKGVPGSQYLARVPASVPQAIENAADWSYFSGLDASGNPLWSNSSAAAAPVWTDPNHAESLAVTFDAAMGRYIAYNDHGIACAGAPCERQVSLFDAAAPWGPWSTVDYEDNFDNVGCGGDCLGDQAAVGWSMMQKWFSSDGLSLWSEYSSVGPYDSLNLIRGTLGLAAGSTISGLAVSTGTPAVLDRLSLSNPGNLEFIDRTDRFTAIPPAYLGLEVIRVARNDAAVGDAGYLAFTVSAPQNVCIAWDSDRPTPAWLAAWTNTGDSFSGDTLYSVFRQSFPAGSIVIPGVGDALGAYLVVAGC